MDNGKNKIKQEFGQKLRKLIAEKGVSYDQAARDLGVAKGTFGHWATGDTYPRIDRMIQLEEYFGTKLSDVSEIEDKKLDLASALNIRTIYLDGVELTEKQKGQILEIARIIIK